MVHGKKVTPSGWDILKSTVQELSYDVVNAMTL
jgi:hypothetical protein